MLALVLTIVALGLMETGRTVAESSGPALSWSMNSPPEDARPGAVWNARLTVFDEGRPASLTGKALPLLTVQSTTTGEWTTTAARPAGDPGFYRARVVLRDGGDYLYSVLLPQDGAPGERRPGAPTGLVLLTLLATLPIAVRRRFPLPVLGITLAAALAADVGYDSFPFPGPLVAVYSVGAHVGRPASLYAAGATAAALPLLLLGDSNLGVWELVAILAGFAAAWLLGDNLRSRRDRKQANVQRTAAEEQARMARELHDIIGHSVSVMTIQAAAAGDAFDSRPAQVREALAAIEATGRETLGELRRLLASDGGSFAPAPGSTASTLSPSACAPPGWRSSCRRSRSRCRRASSWPRTGSSRRRSPTRSSTPARRPRASRCGRPAGTLEIDVVDNGHGAATVTPGHGIIGMRERAAVFGGDLTTGPAPGGGFAVRARIPVEEHMIRVLLVDDQALVRSGFRLILETREDLEVVGEAEDGREAVDLARRLDPHVILMDVRMPHVDGVEATRRLAAAGSPARVLILTTFDLDEYVYEAIRAGASGFLLKDVQPAQLVDAVRVVAAGEALLAPTVTRRLLDRFADQLPSTKPPPELARLTERELEILTLLAEGLSNAELAERLFLSETTVKTHVSSVLRKLELRDRVQAVVLAYKAGLARPHP